MSSYEPLPPEWRLIFILIFSGLTFEQAVELLGLDRTTYERHQDDVELRTLVVEVAVVGNAVRRMVEGLP